MEPCYRGSYPQTVVPEDSGHISSSDKELILPGWGEPLAVDSMSDSVQEAMANELNRAHEVTRFNSGIPLPHRDLRERVHEHINRRGVERRQSNEQREVFDALMPDFPVIGGSLVHSDPHIMNWVTDGDRVRLIDWEYASWSAPEVDTAEFIFDGAVRSYDPSVIVRDITGPETNKLLIAAALSLKVASSLSHRHWRYGEDAYRERVEWLGDMGWTSWSSVRRWIKSNL